MLNLDTHILIYGLQDKLRASKRDLLVRNPWSISAIVLWELAMLSQRKRITIDLDSAHFTSALSRVHIWPLDLMTRRAIRDLDFQSDPADEIIAATSILHRVPLLT